MRKQKSQHFNFEFSIFTLQISWYQPSGINETHGVQGDFSNHPIVWDHHSNSSEQHLYIETYKVASSLKALYPHYIAFVKFE